MKRFFVFAVMALVVAACSNAPKSETTTEAETSPATQEVVAMENGVEVLYFHGKKRCVTCNTIEEIALDEVAIGFAEALQNEKVTIKVVDISLPENEEIVNKYEIAFSSLLLVKHANGEEEVVDLTDAGFAKARSNPDEFRADVHEALANLLAKL